MTPHPDECSCWFVYMISTDRQALYTGITTDVERRFKQHLDVYNGVANSKGAKFFRAHRPLTVSYQMPFPDRSGATKYEHYLKKLTRKQKLALIGNAGELEEVRRVPPVDGEGAPSRGCFCLPI